MFARLYLYGIIDILYGSLNVTFLHEQVSSIFIVYMIVGT